MNRKQLILTTAAVVLAGTTALAAAAPFAGPSFGPDRIDAYLTRMTDRLDLSEEQQAQVRAILEAQQSRRERDRQQTRDEIDALLTPEQREARDTRIDAAIERRLDRLAERLDLTAEQQTQVQALMQARRDDPSLTRTELRERMAEVLDEDQLARLDDRRGGGRPGRGTGDCPRR